MVGSSILPVAFMEGEVYFLFGRESETSDNKFSDFGGKIEQDETPLFAACRECAEEANGFLGSTTDIMEYTTRNGVFCTGNPRFYNIHIVYVDYDETIPQKYQVWRQNKPSQIHDEKTELQWFSIRDIKARIEEFRPFYQILLQRYILEPRVQSIRIRAFTIVKNHTLTEAILATAC